MLLTPKCWAVLIQGDSGAGKAVLLLCDSFEALVVQGVMSPKTTPFETNSDPPMSSRVYATMSQVPRRTSTLHPLHPLHQLRQGTRRTSTCWRALC